MKEAKKSIKESVCDNCCNKSSSSSNGGAVYGMGVIGAAFYFFPDFVGLSGFFMALFKSLFWPAFLVYEALSRLGL